MSGNKITLRKEQVELIEELAHINEQSGLQPAMAKIIALLTVSDEVELTFDQIQDTLGLSKSAVSQALNQLLVAKRIAYKARLGDRRRYFHLRITEWSELVMEQFSGVGALINTYKKILAKRTPKTKEFNRSLQELVQFLSLIHSQLVLLHDKYQKEKK